MRIFVHWRKFFSFMSFFSSQVTVQPKKLINQQIQKTKYGWIWRVSIIIR